MKWYRFTDPSGQDWYVQADNPESALSIAKRYSQNRGYGATDVGSIQIEGEVPNFNPVDPAYGGRVITSNISTSGGGQSTVSATSTTSTVLNPLTTVVTAQSTGDTFVPDETGGLGGSFLRALQQRGINQFGSLGGNYMRQFDPYKRAFDVRTDLGWNGVADATTPGYDNYFQDYVAQNKNPYMDIERAAANFTGQTVTPGTDLKGSQAYVAPQNSGELGSAAQFFLDALRSRIGGYAANRASGRVGGLADQFYALPDATRGTTNFQSYLRDKLGLGNVNFRGFQ